jgi:hypothetical protein
MYLRVHDLDIGKQGGTNASTSRQEAKGRDNSKATTGTGSRFEMGKVVRALQRNAAAADPGTQRHDTNIRLAWCASGAQSLHEAGSAGFVACTLRQRNCRGSCLATAGEICTRKEVGYFSSPKSEFGGPAI